MVVMRAITYNVSGNGSTGSTSGTSLTLTECGSGDVYGVGDGDEFWWYVGGGDE